ncbi:MAG: hypothetical protein ACOY90_01435 [Candidatus Zhuqueibacterota bacterium]
MTVIRKMQALRCVRDSSLSEKAYEPCHEYPVIADEKDDPTASFLAQEEQSPGYWHLSGWVASFKLQRVQFNINLFLKQEDYCQNLDASFRQPGCVT